MKAWVARDKNGRLRLFTIVKPTRHIYYDIWTVLGGNAYGNMGECPPNYAIEIDSNEYPEATWEGEPIDVSIIPNVPTETKNRIRCHNCKTELEYTDDMIKDNIFIVCPECNTELCILD